MKKKRTNRSAEITVETDEILFIKGDSKPTLSWCPVCCTEVSMITPENAARIAGVNTRTIYCWIEHGSVHFVETNGSVSICLHSLALQVKGTGTKIPGTGIASRGRT